MFQFGNEYVKDKTKRSINYVMAIINAQNTNKFLLYSSVKIRQQQISH